MRSRSSSKSDELAPPPDAAQRLADEGRELGRRAAHGERRGRLGPHDRPAGQRGVEGVRDDRQIGQLGHGARDCSRVYGAC